MPRVNPGGLHQTEGEWAPSYGIDLLSRVVRRHPGSVGYRSDEVQETTHPATSLAHVLLG